MSQRSTRLIQHLLSLLLLAQFFGASAQQYNALEPRITRGLTNEVSPAKVNRIHPHQRHQTVGCPDTQPVLRAHTESDSAWQSGFLIPGTNATVTALSVASNGDVYAGGEFTAVGDVAVKHIAKWDGTFWSKLGDGLNAPVHTLASAGDDLYAGGDFTRAGGLPARHVAKWDGSRWSALGAGLSDPVLKLAVADAGIFAVCSKLVANEVVTYPVLWTGSAWDTTAVHLTGYINSISARGSEVYVGGLFQFPAPAGWRGYATLAKWSQNHWVPIDYFQWPADEQLAFCGISSANVVVSAFGAYVAYDFWCGSSTREFFKIDGDSLRYQPLLNDTLHKIPVTALVTSGQHIFVGSQSGSFGELNVYKFDGSRWDTVTSQLKFGRRGLETMAAAEDKVYVGGSIEPAEGPAFQNIAQWDGTAWQPLNTGNTKSVTALSASDGTVYRSGYRKQSDGVLTGFVEKLDGASWQLLPTARPFGTYTLLAKGTALYASYGTWNSVTSSATGYVLKWNGTSWDTLGTRFNEYVTTLAVIGDEVYAGGGFTQVNGAAANHIAKWDGTAWIPLGVGLSLPPDALGVLDQHLYASWGSSQSVGYPNSQVARWDGTTWHVVGADITGRVYAMAALNGKLYVGGSFTDIGGSSAANIAEWDGNSWFAPGNGTSGPATTLSAVRALTVSGNSLYAGGYFVNAGTVVVNRVARWNGERWHTLGSGLNDNVGLLAATETTLYASGEFTTVGDTSKVVAYFGTYDLRAQARLDSLNSLAQQDAKLIVYPNPVSGQTASLTLQNWPLNQPIPAIELYNALGWRVRRVEMAVIPDKPISLTGMLDVPRGIYLIRCGALTQRLIVE